MNFMEKPINQMHHRRRIRNLSLSLSALQQDSSIAFNQNFIRKTMQKNDLTEKKSQKDLKIEIATDSKTIDSKDAFHLRGTREFGNSSAPANLASSASKISFRSLTKVETAILPPPCLTSAIKIQSPKRFPASGSADAAAAAARKRKVTRSRNEIRSQLKNCMKSIESTSNFIDKSTFPLSSYYLDNSQRKQRAHTVIPILPITQQQQQNTEEISHFDSLNTFDAPSTDQIDHFLQKGVTAPYCTSALYGFVDHPNYSRHNFSKNQEFNNSTFIEQDKEREQHQQQEHLEEHEQQHQYDDSFYPSDCFMPGLSQTDNYSNPSFLFYKHPLYINTTNNSSSILVDREEGFSNQLIRHNFNSHSKMTAYPPPPAPEIDPAATAASYGAYTTTSGNGSTGYTVDENGHHVQHLPPLSEALHPDDAGAGGASADHLNAQNAHYGAHTANVYDPHHTGTSNDGSATHGHYDQHQSNNFFDTQIMEPPPPADAHHSTNLHGNGATTNGNNGYGSSSTIMTPPPPASSHGYASSPYQSGGSAPLFHRASISGPVMHSHYPPPPGTPTTAHGADAWSSTPAAARPHTADGMFASQMGGMPGQWASISDYNRGSRGSIGSMSDAAPTSGSSKVFSYMPSNGDDSSSTAGSQGHQTSGGPRKRPRRRYDEIERLYSCSWPGCQKSYGTLNHLNAHVAMQKHGPKRSPAEFKDMRKAWRKSKREDEQRRQANAAAANEEALSRSKMVFAAPNQPFMTHTNYPVNNFMPPPTSSQANNSITGAGNGQVPRYHPQSGMYTGYSHVGALDTGARNGNFAATNAQAQGSGPGGLGAYLMAHRGSI